eukprot:1376749-Amorphochlora_amoeboformis.AAC.1
MIDKYFCTSGTLCEKFEPIVWVRVRVSFMEFRVRVRDRVRVRVRVRVVYLASASVELMPCRVVQFGHSGGMEGLG